MRARGSVLPRRKLAMFLRESGHKYIVNVYILMAIIALKLDSVMKLFKYLETTVTF